MLNVTSFLMDDGEALSLDLRLLSFDRGCAREAAAAAWMLSVLHCDRKEGPPVRDGEEQYLREDCCDAFVLSVFCEHKGIILVD